MATLGDNNYSAPVIDTNDQIIGRFYHSYISPYKGSYAQGAGESWISDFGAIDAHSQVRFSHSISLITRLTVEDDTPNAVAIIV